MAGEIRELVCAGSCVRRDGYGAENAAAEPCEQRLRAVLKVNEHAVAGPHAAPPQACRDALRSLDELAVGPALLRALERRPNQEGLVPPRGRLRAKQRADVLAGEWRGAEIERHRSDRPHKHLLLAEIEPLLPLKNCFCGNCVKRDNAMLMTSSTNSSGSE